MAGVSEVFNLDFKFGGNAEFLSRLEKLMERVDARFESTTDDISDAADATKEMADAVDDLNSSFKSGMSSLSQFGEKLKDIAGYYLSFQAAKAGAERIWSFGMQSMDAYSTQERAENQLKGVMKNRGTLDQFQTIKDYAANIQGRSIYGDEAMIKGAGELATYVKGTESLKGMMDLLTDYAAGMTGGGEVSPEQMESLATGLGMAYDGNYMAMRRKGFDTSKLEALDAIVESGGVWGAKERKKYGDVLDKDILAQIKSAGGVTEQMRVDALKESLGDWKGLSDTVNSLDSSALIRFNNKMGDLREEIGKKIYPTFNKLVESIDKHMPDIEKMFDAVGDCFKRIAETIDSNIDQLIDFGKWIAEVIPEIVEFAGGITKAMGKVVNLTDAFKYLMTYLAVEKVREYAVAINQLFNGDGENGGIFNSLNNLKNAFSGEKGLRKSFQEFGETAAGTQIAIMGITWGLKQIIELAGTVMDLYGAKKDEKAMAEELKNKDNAAKAMISAKKAYNAGKISEDEYRRKYDTYNKLMGGGYEDSYFNIWKNPKDANKNAQKEAKGNVYQQFNTTNIEQNVSLATDIQKVGILLNQNIRAIIESQMRTNREVGLATR